MIWSAPASADARRPVAASINAEPGKIDTAVTAAFPPRLAAALVDPPALVGSTGSTTLLLVVVLLALGAAMIALAVWLVRATRSDPVALGPLEVMGDRHWRRADLDGRRSTLDRARPEGAPPPAPIVPLDPDETEPEAEASSDAEREDVEDGAHPDEPEAEESEDVAERRAVDELDATAGAPTDRGSAGRAAHGPD